MTHTQMLPENFTMAKMTGIALLVILLLACPPSRMVSKEKDPLARLLEGNRRFTVGHPIRPDQTLGRLRQLRKGQHPFAVVVSCSDSRVPPEIIFDQGLGDIFSVRTAGNVIGDYELGSIEYAVEHLGCRLIVVLGHEQCGAVSAFLQHESSSTPGHIQGILQYLASEPEERSLPDQLKHNLDAAIRANILHGVHVLGSSEPILHPLVEKKELTIVGALYRIDSGKVVVLDTSSQPVVDYSKP
jgi:carbonic anhydrase